MAGVAAPAWKRHLTTWLTRLGLALGGIVFALGLLEVTARMIAPICPRSNALWRIDPLIGGVHTPGAHGTFQDCRLDTEFRTSVSINSLGLRDPERTFERPPGTFRIMVIGDSFTEGFQVEREETFSGQLERRLNERLQRAREAEPGVPRPERVEVLNAGVSGWGTDSELLAWRHHLSRFDVDLVVLAFNTGNDVLENDYTLLENFRFPYPDKPHFRLEGDGSLTLQNHPLPPHEPPPLEFSEWFDRLRLSSPLVRWITDEVEPPRRDVRMIRTAHEPKGTFFDMYKPEEAPEWTHARAITSALIGQLAREVTERGPRFAVVVIPDRAMVVPGPYRRPEDMRREGVNETPYRKATAMLDELGVAYLPLLDLFRDHLVETGDPGYFVINNHWSRSGHAIAAGAIEEFLGKQGLLPFLPAH